MSEATFDRGDTVLVLEEVGKAYRRYEHKPFLLRNLLQALIGRRQRPPELWPLRHVSFTARRGEMIGVIGQNGAGKSTLLRLIAGAAVPTEGHLAIRGRVAPLLALGAGFHPDMTGEECIELNGTALGLSRRELQARHGDIVAFAELDRFVDTPVRFYSSGMLARLGFSIAVHTTPDVLLVDEVLAVGDHRFQVKCVERIQELQRRGTTILFVSHDERAVASLCERVLWLDGGALRGDGAAAAVIADYVASLG